MSLSCCKKIANVTQRNNIICPYSYRIEDLKCLLKVTFTDLKCLLKKKCSCHNNGKKSSGTKINKHTPSGYQMFTHCSFDATRNKLDFYRGKDCMERFCKDLKEHAAKTINYAKRK